MKFASSGFVTGFLALLLYASVAEAQMFGDRARQGRAAPSSVRDRGAGETSSTTIRNRAQAARSPGAAADDAGEITGDERFLRESRDVTDFVGRDSRDVGSFVGAQSAVTGGEIRSAIEGELVRTEPAVDLSRLFNLPQTRLGMYSPRLRIGFEPISTPRPAMEQAAVDQLLQSPAIRPTAPLEVSMAGRTATLRGAVASEHEKRLAGLMLLFEPGISKVENELAVAPPSPRPVPPPVPGIPPGQAPSPD